MRQINRYRGKTRIGTRDGYVLVEHHDGAEAAVVRPDPLRVRMSLEGRDDTGGVIIDERAVNEYLGIRVDPPSQVNIQVLNAALPAADGTPAASQKWLNRGDLLAALRAEADATDNPTLHRFIDRLTEATH